MADSKTSSKASTKWKCSKVVYSVWVGQSEFFKGWSDCYWGLERWQTPKFDKSLCIWSPNWDTIGLKNKYVWIRLQTGVKWLFLAQFGQYLKTQKGQTCLPLLPEILKTAPAVIKKYLLGDKQSLQGCRFNYWPTSCTCKASTKWKCSKVVYSVWVGQSEFSKGWSDCYWGLEVADTQIW